MSSSRRRLTFTKSQPESRNNLDTALVDSVDNFLKSLRKTSRKLPPTTSSHASEVQTLERIIYKNKNQHGRTLFFRNLVEIKRFAARIEEANLSNLLERVRAAFYSQEAAKSSAWKSRPWTQVPGIRFLKNILNRIGVLVRLYVKAMEAYRRASIAFTRFSHSTAFLPLAVTALGMAARLCILSLEFCDAAQSMWKDIHQLLAELEPYHQACGCKLAEIPETIALVRGLEAEPPIQRESTTTYPDHDLGERVAKTTGLDLPLSRLEGESFQVAETPSLLCADVVMQDAEEAIHSEAAAPIIRSVQRGKITPAASMSGFGAGELAPPRRRKKKVLPPDEIDSIFG